MEWLQPSLMEILQGLAIAGIGKVIQYVRGINRRLDTLNGSVAKLKEWSTQHEANDDRRFRQMRRRK